MISSSSLGFGSVWVNDLGECYTLSPLGYPISEERKFSLDAQILFNHSNTLRYISKFRDLNHSYSYRKLLNRDIYLRINAIELIKQFTYCGRSFAFYFHVAANKI